MGKPIQVEPGCLLYVGTVAREPCEVKHLSSTWKINQLRRKAQRDSVSSGERTRINWRLEIGGGRLDSSNFQHPISNLKISPNLVSVFKAARPRIKDYSRC